MVARNVHSAMGKVGETSEPAVSKTTMSWLQSVMEFCCQVSIVGVRYVASPSMSSSRRSVWALLVLVGVAFTVYQIHDRLHYYFTHPVNVVIRDVHVSQLRFPTVTICNENRVSLSEMSSLGECYSLATFIMPTFKMRILLFLAGLLY